MVGSKKIFIWSAILFLLFSAFLYQAVPLETSCFTLDSTGYDREACHLCDTGNLPEKAQVQTIGYHLFVALMYKVFGHIYWPIIWLQILFSLCSIWLTYLIACYFFNARVAGLTAVLCAVNVGFLVYPQFILAEALLLFFVLLFVERYLAFWRSKRLITLVQAGLAGGFSVIIKPAVLIFFFFAAPFLLIQSSFFKRRFHAFLFFLLSFLIPVFSYLSFNKAYYDHFNLAPMASLNIYHVFLSKVIAHVEHIPVEEAERKIPPFNKENPLDETGWNGAKKMFWDYAMHHPFACIYVWLQNVSKTLFGLFSTQLKVLLSPCVKGGDVSFFVFNGSLVSRAYQYIVTGSSSAWVSLIAFLEAFWSIIRYFLVLITLISLLRVRRYRSVLFFLVYVFCFSFITGFDGCARYRILFEPLLIIFAAAAIEELYDWITGVASCHIWRNQKKGLFE